MRVLKKLFLGDVVAKGTTRQLRKLTTEQETPLPERLDGALTFSSPNSFTLNTYNNKKNWNGEIVYSTDTKNWNVWDGTTISADSGKLYLAGIGNTFITGKVTSTYSLRLSGSGISCLGNIESLLDYATVEKGEHPTMADYCFTFLFCDCTSLTTAPELPATTLASYCYYGMFKNCKSLTTAPELPATTLASSCYRYMLSNCTRLTKAPKLPATTLAPNCYTQMFEGCTSLTTAPELPATTMATECYVYMFRWCTRLTKAPKLPATTLANGCYANMFDGCTNLTTLPELPATKLAPECYSYMFYECSKIKLSTTQTDVYKTPYRIPTSGTGSATSGDLWYMFIDTGGTFDGTPSINTTYYTSNTVV